MRRFFRIAIEESLEINRELEIIVHLFLGRHFLRGLVVDDFVSLVRLVDTVDDTGQGVLPGCVVSDFERESAFEIDDSEVFRTIFLAVPFDDLDPFGEGRPFFELVLKYFAVPALSIEIKRLLESRWEQGRGVVVVEHRMDKRSEDLILGFRFLDPVYVLVLVLEWTGLVGSETRVGKTHRGLSYGI